jgi:pimeloyl-ACP methyl ester carboxylesterase
MATLDRAVLGEVELEYEVRGTGDPVVLIHPGIFADWFQPLLVQPVLADQYRLVHYHRVGCGGSSHVAGSVSMAQQAAHGRALLGHLGIERAHIVGHSSSGIVALQLAHDAPDVVHSLTVMEPALMAVPSAPTSRAFLGPALEQYRAGDRAGAVDRFLRGTCGPHYRAVLDQAVPGAFAQHVADAETFFTQELPALQQWAFTAEDARQITQPVLTVIGAKNVAGDPIWGERHELLRSWLPQAEPFVLPDATHLLYVEQPRAMAEALAAFFARHPMAIRR